MEFEVVFISQRGQEWGDWQEQEQIAHSISEFRRELHTETSSHTTPVARKRL